MLNTKLKPKNVSDAYILLDVIADPKGCKARLDELVAAEDTAVMEQEKAEKDKRYVADEMAKMTLQLEHLRAEEKKLADTKSALALEKDGLSQQVMAYNEKLKLLELDFTLKDKSLKEYSAAVKIREDEAVTLLDKVKKEMEKAGKEMNMAASLRKEYEDKLKKLKEAGLQLV